MKTSIAIDVLLLSEILLGYEAALWLKRNSRYVSHASSKKLEHENYLF